MTAGRRPRSVTGGEDAPSAHAASLASSAVQPVPCRSAWRGPYASPYAARSRTPLGSGRGFVLFMPVVGPVDRKKLQPTGPREWRGRTGWRGRAGWCASLDDSSARPRSWRTFGPRRLRQPSQACPGCYSRWCRPWSIVDRASRAQGSVGRHTAAGRNQGRCEAILPNAPRRAGRAAAAVCAVADPGQAGWLGQEVLGRCGPGCRPAPQTARFCRS